MSPKESNAYILGTDAAEMHRLGLQHEVWSSESSKAWYHAGFTFGDHILDLGSGPGYCSTELAYRVGPSGKVTAVDKSQIYIDFLSHVAELYSLPIDAVCSDFDDMTLTEASLDGVYCRWALAWLADPESVVENVAKAMKPGAQFISHEYLDWSLFQTAPAFPDLNKGIAAALKSFLEQDGDINVGKRMPAIFEAAGLEVVSIRPMNKIAVPDRINWQWPSTFLHIYFPKLVERGILEADVAERALQDLAKLHDTPGAILQCPHMVEVVAMKL